MGLTYQLRESYSRNADFKLAHAEHVERQQGFRTPNSDVRLRLAVSPSTLSGRYHLSGRVQVHAAQSVKQTLRICYIYRV